MCPSKVAEGGQQGWIVPIGGAEDAKTQAALRRFELGGGPGARIRSHPPAGSMSTGGCRANRLSAGCNVNVLDFDTRRDAQ